MMEYVPGAVGGVPCPCGADEEPPQAVIRVSNAKMQAKVRIRRRLRGAANGRTAATRRAKFQNRFTGVFPAGSAKRKAADPALVGMLTVTAVVFTPTCKLAGVTEHVVPLGAPEQDSETVPV